MSRLAAIFGCEGLRLTEREAAFYRDTDPYGFILFARNIDHPDQVAALTAEMRDVVGRAAPVFVDQEGGRVQRMRAPHWREFAPAMRDGARSNAAEVLELRYRLIAHELSQVGVDVNCAPLLDVPVENAHEVIGERALSRSSEDVAELGWAVRRGLVGGGVLPVIKHMPGHGRAGVDTHVGLPHVWADKAALEQDFAPFRAHSDAPIGMTAHIVYEALDREAPGTFSKKVINLIRKDIGFDGLLLTDDISMGALSGSPAVRARRALDAGCDVVLHCNGVFEEMEAIASEAGAMTDDAARRAGVVDASPRADDGAEIEEIERRYKELTSESVDA